jgi:hypothetical protein
MIDKGYFGSLPRHDFAVRLVINKPVESCRNLPKTCRIAASFLATGFAELSKKQDALFSKLEKEIGREKEKTAILLHAKFRDRIQVPL